MKLLLMKVTIALVSEPASALCTYSVYFAYILTYAFTTYGTLAIEHIQFHIPHLRTVRRLHSEGR